MTASVAAAALPPDERRTPATDTGEAGSSGSFIEMPSKGGGAYVGACCRCQQHRQQQLQHSSQLQG
jgi:hypothetical protein